MPINGWQRTARFNVVLSPGINPHEAGNPADTKTPIYFSIEACKLQVGICKKCHEKSAGHGGRLPI